MNMQKFSKGLKIALVLLLSAATIFLGIVFGSAKIPLAEIGEIIRFKLFGGAAPLNPDNVIIMWTLRIPRAIVAFFVGGLLSMTGAVTQSVLQNPLASPYTLGVSSGAALGISVFIYFGYSAPVLGMFTLPVVGVISGITTVFAAVSIAARIDKYMQNSTIILLGMVISLFANAMQTLFMSLSRETLQQVFNWQMGSLAFKDWSFVATIIPIAVLGVLILTLFSNEMDILSFGDESAFTVGVNVKRVKWLLLIISSALTGSAVALVGIIGFVDLVIPHITRAIFGSSHRTLIPMSFFIGGSFLVFADVLARTIVPGRELPIGVITALIGVPFFIYIYFKGGQKWSK